MPHLHLPIDHTDADVVLAANLAELVGSEDLYVAWSHDHGPGVVPEVEAIVRQEPRHGRVRRLVGSIWRALFTRPAARMAPAAASPRRRRTAGEPSA
jgi:hypothetical protein